jgi:prephenate dehydratase
MQAITEPGVAEAAQRGEEMTAVHEPATVGIQGEPGSFSHEAARALLGRGVTVRTELSFDALFAAVERGALPAALVPIENTQVGSVHENHERLRKSRLYAVAETFLRVEPCLVVRPGAAPELLTRVSSHPLLFDQCQRFLATHPNLEAVRVLDAAVAVREMMQGGPFTQAVIAPRLAAELHGAQVLTAGIQDEPWNVTRFVLLARQPRDLDDADGTWKTSLALRLAHGPGTLHRALSCFAMRGLDLTKIESRAVPGPPWDHVFYIDVVGDPRGAAGDAVEELHGFARELRLLGAYPQALLRP